MAGERSGNLEAVLRRFVEYSKIVATVKRKTISALIYPAILVALALLLVSIIMLKVVPAFSDFYGSFNAQLPLITRVLVGISNFVVSNFWLLLIGGLAAAVAIAVWARRPGQQARLDRWLLGVPMIGDVARKFATSQMARTLSTLLGGGLPLVNALDIAAQIGGQPLHGQRARRGRRACPRGLVVCRRA